MVTNMTEAGVKLLYLAYQKRGAMENLIKESKAGFFMDKTNSHTVAIIEDLYRQWTQVFYLKNAFTTVIVLV